MKARSFVAVFSSILVFAGFLLLWKLITDAHAVSPIFLPAPDQAWTSIVTGLSHGTLGAQLASTVGRMLGGWALASVAGIALGTIVGISPTAKAFFGPTIELLRPIPASAIVPVCIAFFGLTDSMVLAVIVFGSLWPMLLGTISGFASVEPRLYEVAETLCLSRWDIVTKIALPSAVPEILAGLRVGVTLALVLTVLGEMLASRDGLGQWLIFAGRSFRAADLFAGVILLGLLGIVTAGILAGLEAVLLRWRRNDTRGEKTMTRWSAGILGALVLALSVLTAPAQAEPTKLAIGHGFTSEAVSIYVAKNEGIFAKHNIDATITPFGSPQTMMSGLFAGNLQIIMSTQAQFLTAVNGGLDFVVIAGGSRSNRSNDPIGLMLRPDVPYSSPADLKGLTIGVPGFNSGTFLVLKEWLSTKGVAPSSINFVEVAMPNENDLLKGKKVDGVLTAEPFRTEILSSGSGKLVSKYYTEVIPDQPAIFWISTRAWAAKNPAIIAEFRQSLTDAAKWVAANPAPTRDIEKQAFGASQPDAPNFNTTVTAADLQAYYAIGKKLGVFDKTIDVKTLIVP